MIDHAAWIDKLRNECPVLDRQVFDAAEAWRSAEAPRRVPAVYVGPQSDQDLKPDYLATSGTVQDVEALLVVLIVAKERHDPATGLAILGPLRDWRRLIAATLIGWQPNDASTPVAYAGGSMLQWVNGRYMWQDRYRVRYPLASGVIETGPTLVHLTHDSEFETMSAALNPDGTITTEHTP